MDRTPEEHQRRIVEQFTRVAVPFARMPAHSHDEANRLVLSTIGVGDDDTVLDLACGPGLTTCVLAEAARHVTGIDITPAMIQEAKVQQRSRGVANVAWQIGDVTALPFADASFSLVFTRYSFHHLLDPGAVFDEMVRVCRPGGKVAIVDVFASSPMRREAYDRMERLRDPSHTRTLLLEELTGMFDRAGVQDVRTAFYRLEVELEKLLASSAPDPGDADQVRRILAEDLGSNRLGVDAELRDGSLRFAFPIVIIVGRKT